MWQAMCNCQLQQGCAEEFGGSYSPRRPRRPRSIHNLPFQPSADLADLVATGGDENGKRPNGNNLRPSLMASVLRAVTHPAKQHCAPSASLGRNQLEAGAG